MDFNPISSNTTTATASNTQQTKAAATKPAAATAENAKTPATDTGVIYEKGSTSSSTTYKTSSGKQNTAVIEQLKADAEKRTSQLQSIVQKMMTKQGNAIGTADSMWSFLASGKFTVDAATKAQAQRDIADDGYWGVNQTSDRIVDFAKALAGNDPDKADELLEAVKKGFKAATHSWGGSMPDITKRTYDAVVEKFDDWKKNGQTASAEAAGAEA